MTFAVRETITGQLLLGRFPTVEAAAETAVSEQHEVVEVEETGDGRVRVVE